jgi:hypothetical protein
VKNFCHDRSSIQQRATVGDNSRQQIWELSASAGVLFFFYPCHQSQSQYIFLDLKDIFSGAFPISFFLHSAVFDAFPKASLLVLRKIMDVVNDLPNIKQFYLTNQDSIWTKLYF